MPRKADNTGSQEKRRSRFLVPWIWAPLGSLATVPAVSSLSQNWRDIDLAPQPSALIDTYRAYIGVVFDNTLGLLNLHVPGWGQDIFVIWVVCGGLAVRYASIDLFSETDRSINRQLSLVLLIGGPLSILILLAAFLTTLRLLKSEEKMAEELRAHYREVYGQGAKSIDAINSQARFLSRRRGLSAQEAEEFRLKLHQSYDKDRLEETIERQARSTAMSHRRTHKRDLFNFMKFLLLVVITGLGVLGFFYWNYLQKEVEELNAALYLEMGSVSRESTA